MEFEEVLRARQSVRRFDLSRRVTDEEISRILEAAIAAPSAGNLQAWFFVVVKETRTKAEVARGAGQPFVGSAPVGNRCLCRPGAHQAIREAWG